MKISNVQSVVCENCSKLEINYLHNLEASMKYYVLTQYVHLNCGANFAILSDEALSELAAATYEHSFLTKNTFSKKKS